MNAGDNRPSSGLMQNNIATSLTWNYRDRTNNNQPHSEGVDRMTSRPMSIGAEVQAGKKEEGAFELARSRKHLLLYGVPFVLWGSLILLGCKLMEILRRFDEWAA